MVFILIMAFSFGILNQFSWELAADNLLRLSISYLLAIPIGWNREVEDQSAGLRTFPLVAVASCGYVLIGLRVLEGSDSWARILYGLMTGIGFIGGGSILRSEVGTRGTATAASIWNVGAIGAAVAWGRLEIAIILSIINYITFKYLSKLKYKD